MAGLRRKRASFLDVVQLFIPKKLRQLHILILEPLLNGSETLEGSARLGDEAEVVVDRRDRRARDDLRESELLHTY